MEILIPFITASIIDKGIEAGDMQKVWLYGGAMLASALAVIMKMTLPIFAQVFSKYDDLNASVQENVSAIRVVKTFVREDHENEKFSKAAENLYRLYVKAKSILSFNNPIMMLVVYVCIITLSWMGAHFIVGGTLTTGNLTSYAMPVPFSPSCR